MTSAARRSSKHAQGVDERADSEFMPIDRVAQLIGRNESALRRDCAKKLQPVGMARQIADRSTGRAKWHIHRSYDARLVGTPTTERSRRLQDELLAATAEQRQHAQACARVLIAYRQLIASGVKIKDAIGPFIIEQKRVHKLNRLSYKTLRTWNREAPSASDDASLLAFFIDQRGGDRRSITADRSRGVSPDAWAEFERVYLTPQQWSIAKAHRHVRTLAKAEGWAWPSRQWVTALVEQRIEPSRLCMAREGIDVWRSKFGMKLQQHPEAWNAGDMWIGDHARLDFFMRVRRDGKWHSIRAWATAWLDWRTRKLVGWHICTDPSADSIRFALHDAIKREGGPPREVWIDNGKDYASYANVGLTKQQRRDLIAKGEDWVAACEGLGLFGMLGIRPHFALPYNHDGKSRIERFFGTMHGEYCKSFTSYCGAKPGDVPTRHHPIDRLPDLTEVRSQFDRFAQWYNDRCDHGIDDLVDDDGYRLSPTEAMRSWRMTRAIMPRPEALALLLHRWGPPRKVGKLGIGLTIAGRRVWFGGESLELDALKGRDDMVHIAYDVNDLSQIFVYDEQFRFVCAAQANGMHGGSNAVSQAAFKSAIKRKREHERAIRQSAQQSYLQVAGVIHVAQEEQKKMDADRVAERRGEGIAPEPDSQSLRIVRTPVDDASTDPQPMRQAAGAETVDPDDEFKMPRFKSQENEHDCDEDEECVIRLGRNAEDEAPDDDEEFDIWEGLKP